MSVPAYPLSWPAGWKRTPSGSRTRAKFGRQTQSSAGSWKTRAELSISQAVERVRAELGRMGINDNDLVINSNLLLRLDGFPRSGQAEPADPGVAVYWVDRHNRSAPPKCMAIDRYDRVADNLAAVAATLDAMRAIERHGGAEILNRAFAGFTALPSPSSASPWWEVLLVPANAHRSNVEAAYRRMRALHHPDRGGDANAFQSTQRAWEQYLESIK